MRVAGAPISWGVCEVPGWGHQMPRDRVLAEMAGLGLVATETGPAGFLADEAPLLRDQLAGHGLSLVGSFVPLVLHALDRAPLEALRAAARRVVAAGGDTVVLAAATGRDGYDTRPRLDGSAWRVLLGALDRAVEGCGELGARAVFHPHAGTLVETPKEIERVLDGCDIPLCLDTGHVMVGGGDPVALAGSYAARTAHVHLKDVDAGAVRRVRGGATTYASAVRDGMFRPLGEGDVDTCALLACLADAGYDGWLVLEQDVALEAEPPAGSGPVRDIGRSLAYARDVMTSLRTSGASR